MHLSHKQVCLLLIRTEVTLNITLNINPDAIFIFHGFHQHRQNGKLYLSATISGDSNNAYH